MDTAERLLRKCRNRLEYWQTHDLKSGWTTGASGPCCIKCKMTRPKDPLQEAVGCRDPFQIHCDCHITPRRSFREAMTNELQALLFSIESKESAAVMEQIRALVKSALTASDNSLRWYIEQINTATQAGQNRAAAPSQEGHAAGPASAAPPAGKLTKPAQVGNGRFGIGVSERLVIERAQREYEYQNTPEKEAERLTLFNKFQDAVDPTPATGMMGFPPDDWIDEVMAVIGMKCSFANETLDRIERRLRLYAREQKE